MGEHATLKCDEGETMNDDRTLTVLITVDDKMVERSASITPPATPHHTTQDNNNTNNNINNTGNGYALAKPVELIRLKSNADIKKDTSGLTRQYIAAGIVNLGAFAAGVCMSWSSSATPLLQQTSSMDLTDSEVSWVASLLCLGACCGAIPAGLLSEYFGRKKTLLYLALPFLVSWLLLASSPSCSGVYVGRAVGGMAVGAVSVAVPPYVADIAESGAAPALAYFYHVLFAGGILFGYILGLVNNPTVLAVLSACTPVAYFIAFIFLPESPVYLLSQGKSSEAKAALVYFRGIDNDIDQEMSAMKTGIKQAFKNKVTFKELFASKSNLKALFICFTLMVFQQCSGIYAIIFYAEKLFKLGHVSMSAPCGAIILGFCLVSGTYFSTILLSRYPRRALLLFSFGIMAPALLAFGTYLHIVTPASSSLYSSFTWIPVLSLCLYVTAYSIGVGPIPWLMLREIFPSNVTRRATAITAGFHWFLAFLVTKMYQNMENVIKTGWVFWNFGVITLIATVFVYLLVPETYNRTLEEVQGELDGKPRTKVHRHIFVVESVS